MKVLHLPYNIASQASATVVALRALGIDVRGLVRNLGGIQTHDGLEVFEWTGKQNAWSRLIRGVRWRIRMLKAIAWADVIHWHWGHTTWKNLDLRAVGLMGKPALVEYWGDDIRDPEIASEDNPFIAGMYAEFPELKGERSRERQADFQRNHFEPLIPGYEMADYLDREVFDGHYQTLQRLLLKEFQPLFPSAGNQRPLLIHAPSNKARKGTHAVLRAVEQLSGSHDFEFKLIHDMPRAQALELYRNCDVFVDQFTIGAEGLAAHEAMAFGKPVVCFIKDSIKSRYPSTFPVVSADQNNLQEVLSGLIRDGARRRELGILGRQHVEQHNDALKVAGELVEIYRDMLARKKNPGAPRCRHWRVLKPKNRLSQPCAP